MLIINVQPTEAIVNVVINQFVVYVESNINIGVLAFQFI